MMITVDEIMTTDPRTLRQTQTLADARELMTTLNIRHIPIVDEDGALTGLVSQRDILAVEDSRLPDTGKQHHAENVLISDFMTRDLTTIDPSVGIREAALYLERRKFGCLPVVRDGNLYGIVTETDFVAVAINLLEQVEQTGPLEDLD